jgi:hypothetical protein
MNFDALRGKPSGDGVKLLITGRARIAADHLLSASAQGQRHRLA